MADRNSLRERALNISAGVGSDQALPSSGREALRNRANLVRSGGPAPEGVTFQDIDNFVRSMAEGLTFGFADEAAAALNTLTGLGQGMDFQSNLDFERQRQSEIPTGQRIAGNIAGGFLIPGGAGAAARLTAGVPGIAPVTRGIARATAPTRSVRGTAGQGFGFGALASLGASESDDPGRVLQDALIGGGTGAGIGFGLGAASRAISPQVSDDVAALQARGVRPSPGQMVGPRASAAEQRIAQTLPITGDAATAARTRALQDFNRAAANEALRPVGVTVPQRVAAGQDTIRFAQQQVDDLYDNLLGSIPRIRGDQQLRDDFATVLQQTQFLDDRGQEEVRKQLQRVVSRLASEQQQSGVVSGEVAKDLAIQLRNRVRQLRQSTSQFERDIAEPLNTLRNAFTDLIQRNAPSQGVGQQLRDIDFAYAGLRNLENAASRAARNDGVFTPNQLLQAIRVNEIGRRRFARGDALMQQMAQQGQRVLGDTVPDSGTAGRVLQTGMGVGTAMDPGAGLITGAALTAGAAPFTPMGQRVSSALLTGRQGAVPRALSRVPAALTPGLVAGQSVRE